MWRLLASLALLLIAVAAVSDDESERAGSELSEENLDNRISFPPSRRNDDLLQSKDAELNLEDSSSEGDAIQSKIGSKELEAVSRKKVKIKKKHKKYLMQMLMGGLLIKSAMLPLAIGFLKLLTGKAFLMTMMALALVTALTFRSATEHTTTTEVINLVPQKHHRSLPSNLPDLLAMEMLKHW